jgi:hypothetical protein
MVAFVPKNTESIGTENVLNQAKELGKKFVIIT